jgi:integrase
VRKTPTGRFELCVRNRLLPKPFYRTFDIEEEAVAFGQQLDVLLAAGIVPADLQAGQSSTPQEKLRFVLTAWINSGHPASTDVPVLELLVGEVGDVKINQVTYQWAESWVQSLKIDRNFAPGTIRKRVGSLSRALDWWLRKHPDALVGNPLKLLPRGAASYSERDAAMLASLAANAKPDDKIKVVKEDVVRDRRLKPGELEQILAVIDGHKRADRERPLELRHQVALRVLFLLIYHTGMRLREAYTLSRGQVDLERRSIRVRSSKQWRGKVKFRDVPMRRELQQVLQAYVVTLPSDPESLVFPWWTGERTDDEMTRVSSRLATQFRRIFEYARCENLTEHDLRHEATCRWYELRDPKTGAWIFREAEIDKIMGWAPGSSMGGRYASFRAEDLAARLW